MAEVALVALPGAWALGAGAIAGTGMEAEGVVAATGGLPALPVSEAALASTIPLISSVQAALAGGNGITHNP